MKRFSVEITETLQRTVEVEAESAFDAIRAVRNDYNDEKIVLDSDDFIDSRFQIVDFQTVE